MKLRPVSLEEFRKTILSFMLIAYCAFWVCMCSVAIHPLDIFMFAICYTCIMWFLFLGKK